MRDTPIKVDFWRTYLTEHPKFTGCLIDKDNYVFWFLNGKQHRDNGPAVEYANGSKVWYVNGDCHRTDGPAIECEDGSKSWWLNGIPYTEQEHRLLVRQIKLKMLGM